MLFLVLGLFFRNEPKKCVHFYSANWIMYLMVARNFGEAVVLGC